MIYELKGYHIHRQRLFLNNFELNNNETLDHYQILEEDLPSVCEKDEYEPNINISNLNRTPSVDIDPWITNQQPKEN